MAVSLRAASVVCAIVGALLYLNTLDCGLCFDDETAIMNNKDLRAASPWSNLIWNDFWGTPMSSVDSHKSYRPLCVATFRLNYLLHGLQPMGYHLVNVLLHSAVCYLYVQLCGVVFSEVWPALIAGLLFAVHPIHTEAVAGIVGRADIMAAFFYLACLLMYRKAVCDRIQAKLGGWRLAVSLLLCSCSALSKEQGITAIAVCLVYDFFILQKMTIQTALILWRVSHKQKLPRATLQMLKRAAILLLFAGCFMLVRLSLMKEQPKIPITLNPAMILPTPFQQLQWSYLSFFNVWLLLSPSRLCPEYAMGTIPLITSINDPRNLATAATFAAFGYLCYQGVAKGTSKSHKVIVFGAAIMLFSYLPASNLFFPVGFVVAERVLYIPSMGFCILVAYGIHYLATKPHSRLIKLATKLTTIYLIVVYCVKSFHRNRDWLSETTLYHSAVHTFPSNGKMLHNLATDYAQQLKLPLAEKLLRAAASTEPNYINAFSDLGLVLVKQDKLAEAEQAYRVAVKLIETGLQGDKSISVSIKNINTYTRFSKLLKQNSTRLTEAYRLCQNAVRILPTGHGNIYAEMGDILIKMNRSSEAVHYLESAVALQSTLPQVYQNLADIHIEMERYSQAETVLRAGLKMIGKYPPLMVKLALVFQQGHQLQEDARKFKEAEELLLYCMTAEPTNMDILYTLGLLYYSTSSTSQDEKAAKLFKMALHYSPGHQGALLHLGKLNYRMERFRQCTQTLERLLEITPNHPEGAKLLRQCRISLKT